MNSDNTNTHQKAFQINMDLEKYGTFAEIGAGQEVARYFFRVGGAAGTIAKTMSAYDMAFSDAIYGSSERYVSRQRLQTMLDYEYRLLLERLGGTRGDSTTFFVFADTVTAKSYTRRDEAHGWIGIQFQTRPLQPPSQIIAHVRMLDHENVQEQEALGAIGVNLIHGAFFLHREPEKLIGGLMDSLSSSRIEVDVIKFSGPDFIGLDNRLMNLQLVQQGLSNAVLFTPDGEVAQASEIFYNKPLLVERGSFRPVNLLNLDMLHCARRRLEAELAVRDQPIAEVMEMTLRNLLSTGEIDHADFLARVDLLGALGKTVMISNYARFYPLAAHLSRCTKKMIAIAMGVPTLKEIFNEKYYADLEGGILESFGRLFKSAVKLYIYPWIDEYGNLTTADTLRVAPHLHHLYAYLQENQGIESLEGYDSSLLPIHSQEILHLIQSGDPAWEAAVPPPVAQLIKARHYYGWTS
jgi:hypothetical protein